MERHKLYAAVYLILKKEGKYLYMLRENTGYKDNEYSFPSGHVEKGETFTQALLRETQEEIGITLLDPKPVLFMHRKSSEIREYIDVFFIATQWEGELRRAELHKCAAIAWFDNPPVNAVDYVKIALKAITEGKIYIEVWQ